MSAPVRLRFAAFLLVALALSRGAPAQTLDTGLESSPRQALQEFLTLTADGRYADAARLLAEPPEGAPSREVLARQLRAVIDNHVEFDLERVSADPQGNVDDGLEPGIDEIARVPVPGGSEGIRMKRTAEGRWEFSPGTLQRLPRWYEALPDRWIRDRLPEPLLRPGPRHLLRWQWLALPGIALASLLLGVLLAFVLRALLGRLARRTPTEFDDAMVVRLHAPMTLLVSTGIAHEMLSWLMLTPTAAGFVGQGTKAFAIAAVFWAGLRTVDLGIEAIRSSSVATRRPQTLALLPLASRVSKLLLAALAALTILQGLGFPVASVIAGLGIGGLAVALAAQKTVENMFGSVMLSVDQPFRPGDFVKIENYLGHVESVGMRSTRLRTLDRTLVTMPNGSLSELKIESYAARDRIRMYAVLPLVYSTTPEQMRAVLRDIETLVGEHPMRFQEEPARVFFMQFGLHSLDVEVVAFFNTSDWSEFRGIRQELLLQIMEIVQRHGSAFALPTRTVHLTDGRKDAS